MIQKLKMVVISLASMFMFTAPLAVGSVVSAANPNPQTGLCTGANTLTVPPSGGAGGGCSQIKDNNTDVNDLITKIINWISVLVGVVAVIMIIVGGFRYITSGGSPDKVTGAKNTILYGLVGLVIVALAQVIVRFVLKNVTD